MKKTTILFLASAFLLLTISGCGLINKKSETPASLPDSPSSGETETPDSNGPAANEPETSEFLVETRTESQTISSDDGNDLITVSLSLPSLSSDSEAAANVNAYYDNVIDKYLNYAEYELEPMALEQLQSYQEQGYDFNGYALDCDYSIELNTGRYLSVYRELYYYTGGAHPGTDLDAETFDMLNGGLMNLSDVFSVPEEAYMEIIYDEVIAQIESSDAEIDKSGLFENYSELLKTEFDPSDFYLTPNGITVFYQLYSIAPYAAGTQHYDIPYSKFDGILKIDLN